MSLTDNNERLGSPVARRSRFETFIEPQSPLCPARPIKLTALQELLYAVGVDPARPWPQLERISALAAL